MTEDEQRAAVVAAARAWVGTAYHHNASIKGVGVDCGTLLIAVFIETGHMKPVAMDHWSSQFHLHSAEPLYERALTDNGARQFDGPPRSGDIVLYKQHLQFAHGAIVVAPDPLRIIHAYAAGRGVFEGEEFEFAAIARAEKKFFTVW